MNDETIDRLLVVRGKMEQEIATLQDTLAGKRKALQSMNETIGLLRGWANTSVEPIERRSYDTDAMRSAIESYFAEHSKGVRMGDLGRFLEEQNLVPAYDARSRHRIHMIVRSIHEIKTVGSGAGATYELKQPQAAHNSRG